jgi:hypothetical protein
VQMLRMTHARAKQDSASSVTEFVVPYRLDQPLRVTPVRQISLVA